MTEQLIGNDPETQLASSCSAGDTAIAVLDGSAFPTQGNFRVAIDDEILEVTAVSGNTWTVTRAVESLNGSQVAAAHAASADIFGVQTSGSFSQYLSENYVPQTDEGAAGTVEASKVIRAGASKQVDTLAVAVPVVGTDATPGAQAQRLSAMSRKTGITSAAATSIFRLTVPNSNQSAAVLIHAAVAVNNSGALDSTRCIVGNVAVSRVAGANAAAAGAVTTLGNQATSGSATLNASITLGSGNLQGGSSGTQTIDIQLTATKSGGTDVQVVATAELLNSEASGVTIAAV